MIAAGGSRAVRFRSRKPVVVERVQQARRRAIALVPPQPAQVAQGEVTAKIARYLGDTVLPDPILVIDLDMVEHAYTSLQRALPPLRLPEPRLSAADRAFWVVVGALVGVIVLVAYHFTRG